MAHTHLILCYLILNIHSYILISLFSACFFKIPVTPCPHFTFIKLLCCLKIQYNINHS